MVTNSRIMKSFGDRLIELRLKKEWTQSQLAEYCGLTQAHISRVESGKSEACLGTQAALAAGFGLTIAQLFEGVK